MKWRPQTFEDVIGQDHITRTLRNALHQGRIRHAYLFSGPRGTGKTTSARLLAKAVNCQHPDPGIKPCNECPHCLAVNEARYLDLIEIDAASHTGVDDVRDLRDKIAFAPSEGQFKVYIIDEVHRFSGAAFDALLKTLEEPPAHAIFVLATTEINKVPATIKSRCLMFEFRRVSLAEVTERLALIAEGEGVSIDWAALELIAREGTGSVRDSISLLDQLIADPDAHISLEMAADILGTASGQNVVELAQAIIENNAAAGLDIINHTIDGGTDPRQFGRQVIEHLRQVVLYQMAGDALLDATEERRAAIHIQADGIGRKALLAAIRAFNGAISEWQGGWQPQLPLELAFLDSIKPVIEDEPEPAPRSRTAHTASRAAPRSAGRTQDDLPPPTDQMPSGAPPVQSAGDDTGTDLRIRDVAARWPDVLRAADARNPLLPALLAHATPRDLRGDLLILGVRNEIFKQQIEIPEKRAALEQSLADVLGVPLHCKVVIVGESGEHSHDIDQLLAEDDVLAFGVNELGGELTDLDE
ncbi:MAG: DNA polymerase III subunit gamma/tau [Anaerolineae bacterium]|nr:DNA polymerase III subunit gamma/tau [Anaerolineae bacterium]